MNDELPQEDCMPHLAKLSAKEKPTRNWQLRNKEVALNEGSDG